MKICALLLADAKPRKKIKPQHLLRLAGLHDQLARAKQARQPASYKSLLVADLEKQIEQAARILPI